ncbi:MAG TPA: GNAT family N-acetyltransferase [Miltoncostaeaceae bacterium]|jgi:GNAT superfamily N-acetyltransferase|nr:GNAT family N-acetyltransferase [Miltoncostaeaceae bacterium]
MTAVRVEAVPPRDTHALRERVLRPGQTPQELAYPGDAHPDALHAAVRDPAVTGTIVGVATVAPEGHPADPRPGDWRLRGMATAPEVRGRGIGGALLAACLDHARARGGRRVWCNARVSAEGFYLGAGLVPEGGGFDIPGLGEHVVMAVSLRP